MFVAGKKRFLEGNFIIVSGASRSENREIEGFISGDAENVKKLKLNQMKSKLNQNKAEIRF